MVQQLGLEADTQGVLVADVEPGSPADDAGLTPSDVIIEVAKKDLSSSDEFFDLVKKYGKPRQRPAHRVHSRSVRAGPSSRPSRVPKGEDNQ